VKARQKKLIEAFRRAVVRRHTAIDPITNTRVNWINVWDPKLVKAFEQAFAEADPDADYISVEPLDKVASVIEIDGARDLWKKTRDPRWVWLVIQDCAHRREPFPDWTLDYLDKCARGVLRAKDDRGRELLRALGFSTKPGRKRNSSADLLSEQFAMTFAAEIFQGSSAGKARKRAAERFGHWKDDKDRKQRLKDFFELTAWPKTQPEWKLMISQWLLQHPWYTD
jgi:hypothetical protein